MKIEQRRWTQEEQWTPDGPTLLKDSAQLVFVFGATSALRNEERFLDIKKTYPGAHIVGCSTAGEIYGTQVLDHSIITTAIHFAHTSIKTACSTILKREDSFEAGENLSKSIEKEDLTHVFVISDGLNVNGSALVKGLTKHLPEDVLISGGLSGDGDRFDETLVMCDNPPKKNQVVVIGFYGYSLEICCGSLGGWDPFGPERLVTRSQENILYELDGKSALELYKRYLGEHAEGLPATGLLFPLSIRFKNGETNLVRTILSIDEDDHSMIFAGDVPEGAYARFMKANINRLIDGAVGAAKKCSELMGFKQPDLAILISCVGRKMVLKQRVEEEVEGVHEVLGDQTVLAGFYSYGEISPTFKGKPCELHNQTMTITTFLEK